MGPKPRKKEMGAEVIRKEEPIAEVVEQVVEVDDPYIELRYTPLPPLIPSRRPVPRLEKLSVLKKKRFTPFVPVPAAAAAASSSHRPTMEINVITKPKISKKSDISVLDGTSRLFLKSKDEISPNMLNIAAINFKPLSKWLAPAELPRTPQPLEVLRRNPPETSAYSQMIECSYRKEFALLRRFEETKIQEFHVENHIMKNTGKTRQGLLLRKKQLLPHIDHFGEEMTHAQFERTETPETFYDTDIFSEAARNVVEKDGIRRTLTRREKGYKVVTDWIGCPEVTDFIAEMLGKSCGAHYNINYPGEEIEPAVQDGVFVPRFEELAVVGLTYEKVQQQLKEIEAMRTKKEIPTTPFASEITKTKHGARKDTDHIHFTRTESSVDNEESIAGLAIGQIKLFWTRDQDRSKKGWVVELGCTAEIGKDSIGSFTMKNIGTTAVHFKWEKIPPANTFKLKHYDLRRFVFDCWGGVILPRETLRVPVLYKCTEPGFYSEDWKLLTEPVLENGAEIITRLWGITREYDPYRRIREEIDKELDKKIGDSIIEHRVKKLIDYLPVKEVPLKDTRFPLVHLGPDLFHLNNPTLKYHFASVYRLGKLAAMTENKRPRVSTCQPEKSMISIMFTEIDETASEFLVSSKVAHSVNSPDILYNMKSMDYGDEEADSLIKGMYSDGLSVYSDEEVTTSIFYIKRLIEEQISPDIPILAMDTQAPMEDEVDYEETSSKRKRPLSINLINPDFSVDTIRQNILENVIDPQEHREAQFLILSEQVTRLLFSTDKPIDSWKMVVARSLLCNVMETFSDFATSLKEKCCEGQQLSSVKADNSTTVVNTPIENDDDDDDDDDDNEEEEVTDQAEHQFLESSKRSSDMKLEHRLSCSEEHPRRGLQYLRYQDQYYTRLYCRMYSLLSDYLDSFHELLTEAHTLKIVQEDIGFTRVREIPMNFRIEDLLNAPLPPGWVMLAQRMDNAVYKNQARKKALNDGLTC